MTNGGALGTYPHPFYNVDGTGQIYGFHTGGVNANAEESAGVFILKCGGSGYHSSNGLPQGTAGGEFDKLDGRST